MAIKKTAPKKTAAKPVAKAPAKQKASVAKVATSNTSEFDYVIAQANESAATSLVLVESLRTRLESVFGKYEEPAEIPEVQVTTADAQAVVNLDRQIRIANSRAQAILDALNL